MMNANEMHERASAYALNPSDAAMEAAIESVMPLCELIARRLSGRGGEYEDLKQVALMAAVAAIQGFDPERGLKFSTYVTPTITGKVRNYLRDKGGAIRVSRDTRSRLYQLHKTQEQLMHSLQREPSLKETAAAMKITPDELLALLDARAAAETVSMDAAMSSDEDAQRLEARLGMNESGYEQVEQQEWMRWVMQQVTPQERRLLEKRFIDRLGQRETAKALGVSQMQISRMERRVLARLRELTERWQTLN